MRARARRGWGSETPKRLDCGVVIEAKDETISPERPEAEEYRESSTPPKILLR